MTISELLIFSSVFFVFALISRRISGTLITGPMLFTMAGLVLGSTLLSMGDMTYSTGVIHTLAEITLVLVLAADASRISATSLREFGSIPARLLLIGLPLTILTGTLAGQFVLTGFGLLGAALLASILAPTDAALGASVLSNKSVPQPIRQSLNIESGLNDGIALPAVLFFACFFNMAHQSGEENWIVFLALQLSLGPLVGALSGWIGGHLIGLALRHGWITEGAQGVAAMALAVIAFSIAETVGGNGFIAAFVCGLAYGNLSVRYSAFLHEFTETESQTLAHLTFFLFGLVILPTVLSDVQPETLVYAMLSLTLVRMIPVAIAMIGKGYHLPTIAFLGWFGPRGLASLLFALLILEDLDVDFATEIERVVAVTVLLSIVLHGMTAAVFSRTYGKWVTNSTNTSDVQRPTP